MKTYTFAKVSARGYLTEADLHNKWIITDDLGLVINLSERKDESARRLLAYRGVSYLWLPLKEETEDMGYHMILLAVKEMLKYIENGQSIIVHCDFGNNRSRTVVEALHFALLGFHLDDEYKGHQNHLIYNSDSGFLPPLRTIEIDLQQLREDFEGDDEGVCADEIWNKFHRSAFEAIYKHGARDFEVFMDTMIQYYGEEVDNCYYPDQVNSYLRDLWEYDDYEDPDSGICMRYCEWAEYFIHPHSIEIYESLVDSRQSLNTACADLQKCLSKLEKIEGLLNLE